MLLKLKEFVTDASNIGMNSDLMSEYIEFVDRLLVELGNEKSTTHQPFDFMEMISIGKD